MEILQAVTRFVLTVLALISAGIEKEPVPDILLNDDPSPTNLAKIVPAEIVEKTPKLVEVVIADVFETVKRKFTLLLTVVKLLLTVATTVVSGRLLIDDPSPTKRPKIAPAEIVEKTPKLVEVVIADVFETVKRKFTLLLTVVKLVVFETPTLLTSVKLLLTVATTVVSGRLLIDDPSPTKRPKIAPAEIVEKTPKLVEVVIADVFETVKRKFTLLLTVTRLFTFETPTLLTLVKLLLTVANAPVSDRLLNDDPSPTKRPKIAPAEIVEKNP